MKHKFQAKPDPTEAEIAERCAEIQQTWSDATRETRAGITPERVELEPIQISLSRSETL